MPEIEIECSLHRQEGSVSITLREIPMERLDQVLHDISLESWRINVADGIRAQFVAGASMGIPQTTRHFNVNDVQEEDQQ